MAPRRLRVTLDIVVDDLSLEDRTDLAAGICFGGETPEEMEAELPRIAEMSADEVASVLSGLTMDDLQSELWAGSEIYARFVSVPHIRAVWES